MPLLQRYLSAITGRAVKNNSRKEAISVGGHYHAGQYPSITVDFDDDGQLQYSIENPVLIYPAGVAASVVVALQDVQSRHEVFTQNMRGAPLRCPTEDNAAYVLSRAPGHIWIDAGTTMLQVDRNSDGSVGVLVYRNDETPQHLLGSVTVSAESIRGDLPHEG